MSDYFPTDEQDEVTKSILDSYNKVMPRDKKPNFIPYHDDVLDKDVSPFTDFIYYQKLPQVYRDYDRLQYIPNVEGVPQKGPLYRYLQSLLEGGYAKLVFDSVNGENGIDNLFNLIDPQTCPSEFLPIYCKSMGIEWFQDLVVSPSEGVDPYYFMRTFLSNYGEICKRRGTESVVKYIAKVLTSKDVKLSYNRVIQSGETKARILWVEIQVNDPSEVQTIGFNAEVIQRFISTQIPYYLTSRVLYIIDKGDITVNGYTASLSTKVKRTTIIPSTIYIASELDFIYIINNNEATIIRYLTTTYDRIVVPQTLEGAPVVALEKASFNGHTELTYVVLPTTVRAIN